MAEYCSHGYERHKRSSDEMLNISKEEQEFNKLLWASICDVDVFVKSQRTKTKAGPGPDQ